jgi:SAM-dependent methyltransferase
VTDSVRFDRAAGFYDATRGFPPGVVEQVTALLAEVGGLRPTSRVLEIGIGTGRIALPLCAHVHEVVGVDLSGPMLERLLARRGDRAVRVLRADAARLPFADASFDAGLAVHVFHLMPPWREVAAELARVLRPGAPLLVAGDGRNPLWEACEERAEGLLRDVGVPRDRIPTFLGELDWSPRGAERGLRYPFSITPRAAIALLEARSPSSTWRLSEAELARLVDGARRLALERFGDLDRPVELEREFRAQAWLPPAHGRKRSSSA